MTALLQNIIRKKMWSRKSSWECAHALYLSPQHFWEYFRWQKLQYTRSQMHSTATLWGLRSYIWPWSWKLLLKLTTKSWNDLTLNVTADITKGWQSAGNQPKIVCPWQAGNFLLSPLWSSSYLPRTHSGLSASQEECFFWHVQNWHTECNSKEIWLAFLS